MPKQSILKTIAARIPKRKTAKATEKQINKLAAKLMEIAVPTPTLPVGQERIARAQKYAQSSRKNPFVAQIFGDIAQFYKQRTNNTAALGEGGRPPISREVVKISREDIVAIVSKYNPEPTFVRNQTNLIKQFLEKELQILQRAPSETLYKGARKDNPVCAKSKYIFADNDKDHPHGTETIKLFLKHFPSCNPSTPAS